MKLVFILNPRASLFSIVLTCRSGFNSADLQVWPNS